MLLPKTKCLISLNGRAKKLGLQTVFSAEGLKKKPGPGSSTTGPGHTITVNSAQGKAELLSLI